MQLKVLNQQLLDNKEFWRGKNVILPKYDRKTIPVKSVCFSAGRMAYAHTGDIMQDLLDLNPTTGLMVGVETFAPKYVTELAVSDFLMTQPVYENEKGKVTPKVQGAIHSILFVDGNKSNLSWLKLMEYARDPQVQFATINAPEGAYGVTYSHGEFATPANPILIKDMEEGTINSDPAKWTAFALERFKANLKFAMVSCTNFSGNGHYTGATLRLVARAWEEKGFAPAGFVKYLSDPAQFSFPNCMIDRIAVPADETTNKVMDSLGIRSSIVVTEKARYWAVEDNFPAGRPAFEKADGVFMEPGYEDVKKYEDMKLRILNMAHSTIAGIGVLLGYRGKFAIYNAMQNKHIATLIQKIIDSVIATVDKPKQMDPKEFAKAAIERLNNPNIPDDPMRIALNGSTKMLPRFLDTYFAAQKKGLPEETLSTILLPVAGFIRYTMAIDDQGQTYTLEGDPLKELLASCGAAAKIGDVASVSSFKPLITHKDIMSKDLYTHGTTGKTIEVMVANMLEGKGAVVKTLKEYIKPDNSSLTDLLSIISTNNLMTKSQTELNSLKNQTELYFVKGDTKVYKNSLYLKEDVVYMIAKINGKKALYLFSECEIQNGFTGSKTSEKNINILTADFTFENSVILKKLFPFTAPISLRDKKTTVGCGDRLGVCTPGHIRAAKKFDVYPVLAQQSIRELNFTNRTYNGVTSDTAFLVFQEGFERGYGADGDHLKTIADIDTALSAHMAMITLDLSETMNYAASEWEQNKINSEFDMLPAEEKNRLLDTFGNKSFPVGDVSLTFTNDDVKRCTVMYKKAIDFAKVVDTHLKKARGTAYDLEISVDETQAPTLPEHHLYIIKELLHRGILVNSLAPRFIGEFQKAIDYIGDLKEFERQFKIHCIIAKEHGHYKVSVHSGSDKFSAYPTIGKYTEMKLHLKTAGTSWLEAVRTIAVTEPSLYRKIHKKAIAYFDTAKKFYHVTTDLSKIKDIDKVSDADLLNYMLEDNPRQLVHITYGGILNDPEIRGPFFDALGKHEDKLYEIVQKHFEKHLSLLGVPSAK